MTPRPREGFTLIELLVAVAIIAILVAILLPAVQQARAAARLSQCRNNAKQIGLALHNYLGQHSVFPPGSTSDVEQGGWIGRPDTRHIHSWTTMILPFLEETGIYEAIDFSVSSMDAVNQPAAGNLIAPLRCPSYTGSDFSRDDNYTRFSEQYAITNYVALGSSDVGHIYGQNTGLYQPDGTIYPLSSTRHGDVIDGMSNTIIIAETREENMAVWIDGGVGTVVALRYDEFNGPTYAGIETALNYAPYFEYFDPHAEYGPSSMHTGGAIHTFGDGAARFVSDQISPEIYVGMTTRAGAEILSGIGF